MNLTIDNYHSPKANNEYMSVHQFRDWCDCPERTADELAGKWQDKDKPHFVIGHGVDIGLLTPERWAEFLRENAENLFNLPTIDEIKAYAAEHGQPIPAKSKKDELLAMFPDAVTAGKPNANLLTIQRCIARAKADPIFMDFLRGEKQQILTGYLYDCLDIQWKGMFDVRIPGGRIVDLKTSANMRRDDWIPQMDIFTRINLRNGYGVPRKWQKGPWYEVRNYFQQAVVYMDLEENESGKKVPFFLAPVSKEQLGAQERCDIGPILEIGEHIEHQRRRILHERGYIRSHLPQVLRWKRGEDVPPRCEDCDYCASTRETRVEQASSVLFFD